MSLVRDRPAPQGGGAGPDGPIAQLDRVADFYSAGCRFESCWDRHLRISGRGCQISRRPHSLVTCVSDGLIGTSLTSEWHAPLLPGPEEPSPADSGAVAGQIFATLTCKSSPPPLGIPLLSYAQSHRPGPGLSHDRGKPMQPTSCFEATATTQLHALISDLRWRIQLLDADIPEEEAQGRRFQRHRPRLPHAGPDAAGAPR